MAVDKPSLWGSIPSRGTHSFDLSRVDFALGRRRRDELREVLQERVDVAVMHFHARRDAPAGGPDLCTPLGISADLLRPLHLGCTRADGDPKLCSGVRDRQMLKSRHRR